MIKQKLNLAQVTPGMKLAEPITNVGGITLMPAGIRLTPMFIIRMKKWNIESVNVFVEAPKEKKPDSNTRIAKRIGTDTSIIMQQGDFARMVATEVSQCFANVRENPLMTQLRNVAIKLLVAHGKNSLINIMRKTENYDAVVGAEAAD